MAIASTRRAFLGAAVGSALVRPPGQAASTRRLIVCQASVAARTQFILPNLAHIEALPFDGMSINIPASWSVMQPGAVLRFAEVYDPWLAPLEGVFSRVTENFMLAVVRNAADPFDDWSTVLANWVVLARATRRAGLVGILFDNEEYFERLWQFPRDVRYPGKGLLAYQLQYRRRGRELMRAIQEVWPAVRIMHMHGPYVSEPRTPAWVPMEQVGLSAQDLRGQFFAGMLQAVEPPGSVIDGGEVYQYRDEVDFERSYRFRKGGIAELEPGTVVPGALRGRWRQRIELAFGTYDLQWRPGFPMSPGILTPTLVNALRRGDRYVWLFTEGDHDYLTPGGIDRVWVDAVRAARQRAGLPP